MNGGGGASTGIELAVGRSVDIAINHDEAAILMHKTNHPSTTHYCENVWDVDPRKATKGQPVGLAWFSPDCKHFSKAKGGKPVEKRIRGLAWIVLKWAGTVRPRVIMLENVEEFQTWGPIRKGRPIKSKQGETFRLWKSQLESLGYTIEHRELRACDYGAPTTRKRFFLIARCDGKPIVWPEPTHAPIDSIEAQWGLKEPYRTAGEIIDWSVPCPSIFNRSKPLSENTMRRIAKGIQKYIIEDKEPYMVPGGAAFLTQYHSFDNNFRGQGMDEPLLTVDTSNRYGLVTAFISRQFKSSIGHDLSEPLGTITTVDKSRLVEAFLIKYYGCDIGQSLKEPLHTITSKDRFGLITVKGEKYQICDIGMRMLEPRELFNAQGFPDDYIIDRDYTGREYPKTQQVARCGNAVPPPFAKALVEANLPEMCIQRKEKQA